MGDVLVFDLCFRFDGSLFGTTVYSLDELGFLEGLGVG